MICDRDRKWSGEVRRVLGDAGVRVVQTPVQAPNAKDYASCGRSKKSVSIGWCRSVNDISGGPSQNSWRTAIVNGIIKGWAIG
jgi:hypothetical protein